MVVLNLILLLSYLPFDSSFISTQFFVLNWEDWFVVSLVYFIGLLFFDIPLLCYLILLLLLLYWSSFNLRSSIIFCVSSGDIYFPLRTSSFVSKLLCSEVFDSLLNLLAILYPIKSPVAFAGFWIALFETVLSASLADC